MKQALFRAVRRSIYNVLKIPPVNVLGRVILSQWRSERLYKGSYVFPVKGTFPVKYPAGHDFQMCSDGSDTIASRVYFGGALQFENATSSVLTKYFAHGGVFFDIGANSGLYSLMAATFPVIEQGVHP